MNPMYKAFVSYSHAADGKLSPAIQSGLQRFAKAWYQSRAMRVFRDETSLSANPALWESIEKALEASEYFLLLASPQAAQSPWVRREIDWWLEHRPRGRLLILRDIDTPQRLRLVAPALEFTDCLNFLLRCVPNFTVHTRGFLAFVFCHSTHGESFAAVRVGQQALQGSHLAPSALLRCLRDTHLESANMSVDGSPIDGIPFCRFV